MNPEDLGASPSREVQTSADNPRGLEWRRFFTMHPQLRKVLNIVAISAITSLVVLGLAIALGWSHREKIAALLITTLPSETSAPTLIQEVPETEIVLEEKEEDRELTVTEVVAKVNPSVVSIEVSRPYALGTRVAGKGTGFFVTANGYIITNRHVIDETNATYAITTASGKKYAATLVAKDPVYDLAVLKVQGSGFSPVALGDPSQLQLGQSVVAIGFALGKFENSISVGVISGLSRSVIANDGATSEQLDRVIQTDAAINPGNSGGPLIDLRGNVIGVNVAVARGGQNVGFAIPADSVKQVIDSVKAYGFIVRPYAGISYVPIDAEIKAEEGLPVDYGIYVTAVMVDFPAARAGIQINDIILSVDGVTLDGDPSFSTIIRNKKVGQNVSMVVLRDGVQRTVRVQLAQAPDL